MIDTLDFDQKQTLLRLIVEEVHVTGWHVQIRLRIPLDDNPDGPPRPPNPDPGPDRPNLVSTEDRLRSLGSHQAAVPPHDRGRGHAAGDCAALAGRRRMRSGEQGSVGPVQAGLRVGYSGVRRPRGEGRAVRRPWLPSASEQCQRVEKADSRSGRADVATRPRSCGGWLCRSPQVIQLQADFWNPTRDGAPGSRRPWLRRIGRAAPASSARGRASGTRVGRPQRRRSCWAGCRR